MLLTEFAFVLSATREVKASNVGERHNMLTAYLGRYSPSFSNYFLTCVHTYRSVSPFLKATKTLRESRVITLFQTSALEGCEGSASRPGRFLSPGKTRYPLYRRLGGPQGRSGQVRKISPPPGFDP
jgi:hypothetical protein